MAARSKSWSTWVERSLWVVLAGVLLYRCVLPVPSAPVAGQLASARLATDGRPIFIEFSSRR